MFHIRTVFGAAVALLLARPGLAEQRPWSVTVWGGPSTTKYFVAVVQDFGNLQSRNALIGAALDRRLAYLGYDIYLAADIEATQTLINHHDTTFAFGLGFQARRLFGFDRTSLSFYTGPSYSLDPPYVAIGYKHRTYPTWRHKFLNAVTIEFASGLPFCKNWDWTARIYHRSGAFGVYSDGDDDGLAVGLGLKYHF